MEASASFEQALGSAEQENLLGLCDAKAAQMPGEDGETWAFLRIHLESDPRRCAATSLLSWCDSQVCCRIRVQCHLAEGISYLSAHPRAGIHLG